MTAKTVNYTDEQVATAKAEYLAGTAVETIAEMLGKSVKSIVAKLSREGVYKAKERKTAGTTARKDEIVLALELMTGTELKSFNHATRADLEKLLAFIKREG